MELSGFETLTDEVVCHCLGIARSEIVTAADVTDATSVRDIMKCTGAGTGCTACHGGIRRLLANQCPSGSSPTCVTR
jgi:NAD(P)H-nitrite reductase large subunit